MIYFWCVGARTPHRVRSRTAFKAWFSPAMEVLGMKLRS